MKYVGGISIIIPIYNEETLLTPAINDLVTGLKGNYVFEIILIENGSKDTTYIQAMGLAKKHKMIRVFHLDEPCYGAALKKGIIKARYPVIVQFDLDLIDLVFLRNAVALLSVNDIVVGSKMLPSSQDKRAPFRYFASKLTNFMIKRLFGYQGTDTHGIKAYRAKAIRSITKNLAPTHHFFDTEILLVSEARKLRIVELPVSIHHLRPTRFNTKIILFQALGEFVSLFGKRKSFLNTKQRDETTYTADDFGLNEHVCMTVSDLIQKKKIHKVSVLPNMLVAKRLHAVSIAAHLNLIEGIPVLPPKKVPSLVNKDGHFYPFPLLYLRLCLNLVRFDELSHELDAQIALLKKRQGKIFELNSHQHTHTLYPMDQFVALLSKKHGVPTVRRYGVIHHHSFIGVATHFLLTILVYFEHALYGKNASQSPIQQKNAIPISFMSWESALGESQNKREIVFHPGTRYDKTIVFHT